MPKKHLPKFLKSQPSLHTSHTSSSSSFQNASTTPAARDQSVNDLLAHLRTSQPNPDTPRRQISTIPSVPPSLQLILANAEPPLPPRPRPQIGVRGRRNRIPGPPPPASWLAAPEETSNEEEAAFRAGAGVGGDINRLPDLPQIAHHRLAHAALVAVARNWHFHTVYDQHYLYTLRPGLKALLLSYIATHNAGALQADDLRLLFRDGDDEDFTYLDLSRAVGPSLTFKDLRSLCHGGKPGVTAMEASSVSDDWDAAADTAVVGRTLFAAVTHISLAWPAASEASWARLMRFVVQCVPTITHLSLAGWGHPGAAGVLRRFARSLLCLKWLDVSDCPARIYDSLREEVEWDRAWRGVETVVCVQVGEGTPQRIREERGRAVAALREHIRGVRAEVGGRWCRVVECGLSEIV